jgi:hypothetical protein
MLRNKIILSIGVAVLFIAITTIGQKPAHKKNQSKNINIDSLIKITIEKNEKTITKRIGELKHAEKAADILYKVVTSLEKENKQLHKNISNIIILDTNTEFKLLPISEN